MEIIKNIGTDYSKEKVKATYPYLHVLEVNDALAYFVDILPSGDVPIVLTNENGYDIQIEKCIRRDLFIISQITNNFKTEIVYDKNKKEEILDIEQLINSDFQWE